ncbi:MAG: oxidoreductase [Melioribacteraceae bacterium]|nr:MAG: oxidoreductase [Melioribacteraceae bacterium]
MLSGKYKDFHAKISTFLPKSRVFTDELRKLTYGTDAGFYRLIPQIVVKIENEDELISLIHAGKEFDTPLTFRAAGTSLSGQAITNSVLVLLTSDWKDYKILENGDKITMQPGLIGAHANLFLSQYNRKLGPDPASINAAKIAGIAANNASGMTSGTKKNIYNTLLGMKIVLPDGYTVDTFDTESREKFRTERKELHDSLKALSDKVKANDKLRERIIHKYRMKNTTGYSLNALVEFDDPLDILAHLMIGSEGTLGFISNITLQTVPELPNKATALILFTNIKTACEAIPIFQEQPVDAAEIMDRAALRSVENKPGMPPELKQLNDEAAALLIETSSDNGDDLQKNIDSIVKSIEHLPKAFPVKFTTDKKEYKKLWDVRKGLFPSACKTRKPGTAVIIEDVNFPVERLAEATLDLQAMFKDFGYDETIIWGHSLAGNLHFVFSPDFSEQSEIDRYSKFMDAICELVVKKYDGSLKAEHGTGRNMAPYVKYEWGEDAYKIMKEIKQIIDPDNLFNPGVVLNEDPEIHLKNLKPLPIAHEMIDQCIECGFCEHNCPSRELTLTPRQRIVAYREISRLHREEETGGRLKEFEKSFDYYGNQTCATDGLCATSCPVDIDTGKLIKHLRSENVGILAKNMANKIGSNMNLVTGGASIALDAVNVAHSVMGTSLLDSVASAFRKISGDTIPMWNKFMPKGAGKVPNTEVSESNTLKVVYFPSCISRGMGPAKGDSDDLSQSRATHRLLRKAGYDVIYPENLSNLCCGMAFNSKGFVEEGKIKSGELWEAVQKATENSKFPVLFDTSPCTYHFRQYLEGVGKEMKIYEPIEFILEKVADKLNFTKIDETVSIHTTCSSKKMGLDEKFKELTEKCVTNVIIPHDVGCCGWAGDRGFTYPELNEAALKGLKEQVTEAKEGYSTSRTCEIGLSLHSGKYYKSVIYLVDRVTEPK